MKKILLNINWKILGEKYYQKSSIWRYTCENFLYSMLNQALRSFEMKTIPKLGFVIRNLHQQLHREQSNVFKKKFIVYCGQGLNEEDFNHLNSIEDGLLSFNNFLSTNNTCLTNTFLYTKHIAWNYMHHKVELYITLVLCLLNFPLDENELKIEQLRSYS